jgi:glycerophosphoryl diester phosphodiesterase
MSRHAVLAGGPLLIAHRGGSGLAPENTLAAFHNGATTWAADMIELDVRASADGECVVIHDATIDRTTNGRGSVAGKTVKQLQSYDAGYHFTPDGGRTFPFRDRGVTIPTLPQVLEQLPDIRITIEVKAGAAQQPMFAALDRFNARKRVVAAGMYEADRTMFVDFHGAVSASGEQLKSYLIRHRLALSRFTRPKADVVQMCEQYRGRRILSRSLVQALKRAGVPVHVWTVNELADMNRLLDWGVDGLLTDFPDRLGLVLHERFGRPLAPGHLQAT